MTTALAAVPRPATRAAIYVRQSRDQHGTGLAVARQLDDCRRLCGDRGWDVAEVYSDNDTSASTGRARPAYQRLLGDIEAGKVDAVVVWDLDRLHRRPVELEHFIELADRHRLALASVGGDADLSTDNGRLFARVKGAVARGEVERKAARQRAAAEQRARMGVPQSAHRAFGYRNGREVEPREAEALARAYHDVLNGRSLSQVARDLDAAGFITPSGRRFGHTAVRSILLNPRNAGLRAYRGEIRGPGQWPAVIGEDVYHAVVGLLTNPRRRTNHGTARRWLLAGLARCGVCGDGTTLRVTYRDKGERLYACRSHAHLGRAAERIEAVVVAAVVERLSRPDARDLLVDESRPDVAQLRGRLEAINRKLTELAQLYAEDAIDAAQLRDGSAELRAQRAEIESAMAHVDRAPLLADLITSQDVAARWAELPLERKRAVIDTLMAVTVLRGRPGRAPFDPRSVLVDWRAAS